MPIRTFLATLCPLYILLGCILVSCARLLRYNIFWSFLIKLINGLLEFNSEGGTLCGLSGSLLVKIGFVRNMV